MVEVTQINVFTVIYLYDTKSALSRSFLMATRLISMHAQQKYKVNIECPVSESTFECSGGTSKIVLVLHSSGVELHQLPGCI